MKAPRFWREPAGALAWALSPLGAVYGAVTAWRMGQPGVRVKAPVLCVGNFTVGGTGKTPTALALARLLRSAGERPAFLSRGYGGERRAESVRVALGASARSVGDEPLLLARMAPCYVGPDRLASAQLAIEEGASVLVMDDGLQNPKLHKTLTCAVVDADSPFGNGLCLPAGPLRAPVAAQAPFVDAIILIGGDAGAAARLSEIAPDRPIFRAALRADALAASALIGRPVLAFAGIGRPEKFFATLAGVGANVVQTAAFPDHWPYSAAEIERLAARASRDGLTLVCTEKDHVRLPPALAPLAHPLPVTLAFEAPGAVLSWLARLRVL